MSYAYSNKIVKTFAFIFDMVGSILFFWIRKNKTIDVSKIKKILIIKFDHLGDCFLSTPLFESLKARISQANIDVLCQENSSTIFDGNPYISEIITFNYPRMHRGEKPAKIKDFFSLFKKIKSKKYDVVIDLRGEPFAAFLSFLSGARCRIGFEKEEIGGFLYTHPLQYERNEHESKRYEKIEQLFKIERKDKWLPKIYCSLEEENAVRVFLNENYGVIHPSAGANYKIWPEEKFVELIKLILEKYNTKIFILGDNNEKEKGERIKSFVRDIRVKNLAGKFSLRESYIIIKKAKFFVGNDSVLGHFAGSFNIPTIILMNGVIDSKRWSPLGEKVKVIQGINEAHKCLYDKDAYPCPNMEAINSKNIFYALNSYEIH